MITKDLAGDKLLHSFGLVVVASGQVLRLITGVFLEEVALVFIGVEVVFGRVFSASGPELSKFFITLVFRTAEVISSNICF